MMQILRAAHAHRGASFVEIYQNCNVFNDHQFDDITKRSVRDEMMINLVHGEPILFGAESQRGVMMGSDGFLQIVEVADVGLENILIHDQHHPYPSLAFALGRLNTDDHSPTLRHLPRGRAPGVRLGGRGSARRCVGEEGPRRPRRAAAQQRHLAGQLVVCNISRGRPAPRR
jgi:hypothetical protein